jgi:hypothetical protein
VQEHGENGVYIIKGWGTEEEGGTGIVYKGGESGVEVSGPPPFSLFPHLTVLIHPPKTVDHKKLHRQASSVCSSD